MNQPMTIEEAFVNARTAVTGLGRAIRAALRRPPVDGFEKKLHWYHVSFMEAGINISGAFVGNDEPSVSCADIKEACRSLGLVEAVLIACSYVGHMTHKELGADSVAEDGAP